MVSKNKMIFTLLLSFLTIINIAAQFPYKVENEVAFFSHIHLDYPGLEAVKEAVKKGDYTQAKEEYIRFFRHRTDRQFMFNGDSRDDMVKGLRNLYPDHEQQVLKRAERTMRFELPIQDRVHHWTNGDITWRDQNEEWINLLNRMEYLIDLGQAYWYTGDERYFDNFWHWYTDWLKDNPVPDYEPELTGGTWEPLKQSYTAPHGPWRALEVGLRVTHILQVFYYFDDAAHFTTDKKWEFLRSMMEHQRYVYEYLKRTALGNWENFVSTGFLRLSVLTPEWKNSEDILQFCLTTLQQNMLKAVNEEGFQFELTMSYHKHVAPNGIKTHYFLSALNGLEGLDEKLFDRIKKSYDVVASLKKPDNRDPVIGDSGMFYQGTKKETIVPDNFFSDAALIYKDPLHKSLSGGFAVDDYLFFGHKGYEEYLKIEEAKKPTLKSTFLPISGMIAMRSGFACMDTTYSSLYCFFDNATDGAGAHQHHDFLNLELFAYDKTLLIDPGYGNHYNAPLFFPYYRAIRGHNVIQVGEKGDIQLRKPVNSGLVKNDVWESNQSYDFARGILFDYDGIDHYRELLFIKGEYWFLRDRLVGDSSRLIKQYFHTLPGEIIINEETQIAHTNFKSCSNLCWIPVQKEPMRLEIETGYVSNKKENLEAPIVTYSKEKKLPITFETILFPVKNGSSFPDFKITAIPCHDNDDTNRYLGFCFEQEEEKNDYFFISEEDKPASFGQEIMLTGSLAFCREVKERPEQFILRGKRLKWKNYIISSDEEIDISLSITDSRTLQLYCSHPGTILTLPYDKRIKEAYICLSPSNEYLPIPILENDKKKKLITLQIPYKGEMNIKLR